MKRAAYGKDKLSEFEKCAALAQAIKAVRPSKEKYVVSSFELTYNDYNGEGRTVIKIDGKKGNPIAEIEIVCSAVSQTLRVKPVAEFEDGARDFRLTKTALRQFLLGIPLQDFAYNRAPSLEEV
jgi:hypothetical protein